MIRITRKDFQKLVEVTLDDTDFENVVNAELEDNDSVTAAEIQQSLEDEAAEKNASISDDFDTEEEIAAKLGDREDLNSATAFSVTEVSRSEIRNIMEEVLLRLMKAGQR